MLKLNSVTLESGCLRAKKEKEKRKKGFRKKRREKGSKREGKRKKKVTGQKSKWLKK